MKTKLTASEGQRAAPAVLCYGIAVLSVGVALIIALWAQKRYGFEPFVPFLCAMMLSALLGGLRPGLLATALSMAAFHYYLLVRVYPSFGEKEMARLLLAALTGLFVVLLGSAHRKATDSLKRAHDAVERSAQELRRTNESLQTENAERRRAEEALKKAEYNIRLIMDATPALIHSGRPDGHLDFFNQRWLNYVGFPLEKLQGWGWTSAIHPDDVEGLVKRWRACVASGEPYEYEARVRRADGKYRWMLHRKEALRDEHGNIVKWCGSSMDIDDRRHAERLLEDSHARLRGLSAQIQSCREQEATRISREIHDDLGQKLTGLKMDLARAERKIDDLERSQAVNSLLELIVSAAELADEITASVQEIAANLRPEMLDKLGLSAALRCESRRFQERTGILCETHLPETDPRLSTQASTALFRIFQECLTNIARHAGATKVEATLRQERDRVTLSVQDNGRGITESEMANPESLGLLGMKERAAMLDGEVVYGRAPGGGTIITVQIPQGEATLEPKELVRKTA